MAISKDGKAVTIRVLVPIAQAVFALGRFNDWSTTATPLSHRSDGSWTVALPPNVSLKGLCFFVISVGETFGRIMGIEDESMRSSMDSVRFESSKPIAVWKGGLP